MEILIKELTNLVHRPSPQRIQELQRAIQQLQREKSGWQKGFELLQSDDQTLRFNGALTLTIKINADWVSDDFVEDESARRLLLEGLLNAYTQLANASDAPFILVKLCSTLTVYFIKDDAWRFSVRQVSATLLHCGYVPFERVADASILKQILSSMNFCQLRGVIYFASTLVEDISRLDNRTSCSAFLLEKLASNSEDVWVAIKFSLDACISTTSSESNPFPAHIAHLTEAEAIEVAKLAIQMILPWLEYLPPLSQKKVGTADPVVSLAQSCVSSLFTCFFHSTLQDLVVQTLTGVAESYDHIFRITRVDAVASITTSREASKWINEMQQGQFSPEAVRYVEFLIALIKSKDLSSAAYLEESTTTAILYALKKLMHCEGVAVVEDEVCQLVLECLSEVVEQYNSWPMAERNANMKSFISETCLDAISKAQFPVNELDRDEQTWDADERAKFQDFRMDVVDFLSSAFVTLGYPLIHTIAKIASSNDFETEWSSFEISLFCLLELSDTMNHNPEQYDPKIHAILSSSQWNLATQKVECCPSKVRQTAIRFVSQQTGYLRRNVNFLIPCLDFLFHSLHISDSAQAASRAVHSLCSSERRILTEALPQFMSSLDGIAVLEPTIKHKVYSAVAAIIQALPTEDDKIEPLDMLLSNIALFVQQGPSRDVGADREAVSIDVLQALAAVGRGLRAPTDVIIDLESSKSISKEATFWTSERSHGTQLEALSLCTNALNIAGVQPSTEVVEAACDFMKSGYTEDDPSPFKFSASISVDFLTSQLRVDNMNIDAVMGCASAFMASTDKTLDTFLFARLMDPIFSFCQALIAQDCSTGSFATSDFLASSVDLLTRLLPKWSSSLLTLPNAQLSLAKVLDVALILFAESDTLPRRSAASFFAAIFELSGHNTSLSQQASSTLSEILITYTTPIVAITLRLIAGECARSEIEATTEVLRKIISKQTPTTRRLLTDAMNEHTAFLSPKAYAATTLQQRLRFVAQAEALRGARKTGDVAKDFWVACRGDAFGYIT